VEDQEGQGSDGRIMSLFAACQSMFRLNRSTPALSSHQVAEVYRIKTQFIRWLEEAGYCVDLRRQDQGKHRLWRFVFEIPLPVCVNAKRTYIWHLPVTEVTWKVLATGFQLDDWNDRKVGGFADCCLYRAIPDGLCDIYRVWWFLVKRGVIMSPPLSWHRKESE